MITAGKLSLTMDLEIVLDNNKYIVSDPDGASDMDFDTLDDLREYTEKTMIQENLGPNFKFVITTYLDEVDFGDVFTLDEFDQQPFNSFDGHGYYALRVDGTLMLDRRSDCFEEHPEGYTHVVWYNK